VEADINFRIEDYEEDLKQVKGGSEIEREGERDCACFVEILSYLQ
jgi:hypothetical protein